MLESKLWHNKTDTKKAKCAKMVGLNKTNCQYPHKFYFGHFFSSIVSFLSPLSTGGINFQKNAAWGKWLISFILPRGDDKNRGAVLLREMSKCE